jgi:hypothetical protein
VPRWRAGSVRSTAACNEFARQRRLTERGAGRAGRAFPLNAVIQSVPHDMALPRYDDMCRAIAECHRVDEAKDYRDKAEALRAYAKQAGNRDAEVQFAEIKVRAEIKCGELLKEMAESGERAGRGRHSNSDSVSHLTDLGIDPKESERFQQAANASSQHVEEAFNTARETRTPVTSAQIRNLTRSPEFTPEQRADHERLWRVLRALEQISDQDIPAAEWLDALPDYMRERVSNHLKKARPWLERLFELWDTHHAN